MPSWYLLALYWTHNLEQYSRGCSKPSACWCDRRADGLGGWHSIMWLVTESLTQSERKIRLTWCVLYKLMLPGCSVHLIIFRWPQIDHFNNLAPYLSVYWRHSGQHLPWSHDLLCMLHTRALPYCLCFSFFFLHLPHLSATMPSAPDTHRESKEPQAEIPSIWIDCRKAAACRVMESNMEFTVCVQWASGKTVKSVASGEQWEAERVVGDGRNSGDVPMTALLKVGMAAFRAAAPALCCCCSWAFRWILWPLPREFLSFSYQAAQRL